MSKKILIVEDEFVVANNLRLILEEAGYSIHGIAASASEAKDFLMKDHPDLVLLDIMLKGKLTGIDIARKLRVDNIPFVYLSANANQTILEEAKTTEPYGFLVKPFRKKDLLIALEIAEYLHKHSLESKLRREEQLKNSIRQIGEQALPLKEAVLKMAAIIQPYIPFDFMACGTRPLNEKQYADTGYVRAGFDEYQYIGEKELMNISGLDKNGLSQIIENSSSHTVPAIYDNEANSNTGNLLQRKIMDHLGLESYLVFPVPLGYGLSFHYFFYSRKSNSYHKDHIALLNRLRSDLEEVFNKSSVHAETNATKTKHTNAALTRTENDGTEHWLFKEIIGSHHLLLSALDLAAQVAPYNTSVLILGESGTGKEKVAEAIHQLSPRKNGPFIKVNCAAIPATLIESELFGHEKGAFTGATEKRKGKFELADKGTIFLDEIGELPLNMQVKLLRVLQEREIEYVGGSTPVKLDVRIIAATNRNLEKEVAERNFRLDLYFRLNVFPLTLPALRERKADIASLALFFAKKFCKELHKPFNGIADTMMEKMEAYHWPGNIRELQNIVEQSVVLNDGKSKLQLMRNLAAALPETGGTSINTFEEVKHVQQQTEREYISSILKKAKGRIRGANGAAALLNIKPSTLESKMSKLNINRQDFIY